MLECNFPVVDRRTIRHSLIQAFVTTTLAWHKEVTRQGNTNNLYPVAASCSFIEEFEFQETSSCDLCHTVTHKWMNGIAHQHPTVRRTRPQLDLNCQTVNRSNPPCSFHPRHRKHRDILSILPEIALGFHCPQGFDERCKFQTLSSGYARDSITGSGHDRPYTTNLLCK